MFFANNTFRLNILFRLMNKIHMLVFLVMFHIVIILDFLKHFSQYGHLMHYLDIQFIHGLIGNLNDVLENCPVNSPMKNHLKKKPVVMINRHLIILLNPLPFPFFYDASRIFFFGNHVV